MSYPVWSAGASRFVSSLRDGNSEKAAGVLGDFAADVVDGSPTWEVFRAELLSAFSHRVGLLGDDGPRQVVELVSQLPESVDIPEELVRAMVAAVIDADHDVLRAIPPLVQVVVAGKALAALELVGTAP